MHRSVSVPLAVSAVLALSSLSTAPGWAAEDFTSGDVGVVSADAGAERAKAVTQASRKDPAGDSGVSGDGVTKANKKATDLRRLAVDASGEKKVVIKVRATNVPQASGVPALYAVVAAVYRGKSETPEGQLEVAYDTEEGTVGFDALGWDHSCSGGGASANPKTDVVTMRIPKRCFPGKSVRLGGTYAAASSMTDEGGYAYDFLDQPLRTIRLR